MSYNIDSTACPVLDAWMNAADIVRIQDEHEGDLPECNFVTEHYDEAAKVLWDLTAKDKRVELENLWWFGEGSGNSYDFFVEHIAPKIMGHVEAIFTWEGGDSFAGLFIDDGVVVKGDVEMRVVKKDSSSVVVRCKCGTSAMLTMAAVAALHGGQAVRLSLPKDWEHTAEHGLRCPECVGTA